MLVINDWGQFWISFWSSLFAGAIDSLLVGFIVGVMILIFQWKIDERRNRHNAEREIATFREQMRLILSQPDQTFINNITMPDSQVKDLVKLLSESPLDLWHNLLPIQRGFILKIKDFQNAYANFSLEASKLDISAKSAVRRLNHTQGLIQANDGPLLNFLFGRTLGFDNKSILPWIGPLNANEAALEERYKLLLQEQALVENITPYKEARSQLERSITTLSTALSLPPPLKTKRWISFKQTLIQLRRKVKL